MYRLKLPIFINGLLPNTRDLRNGKDGGSRVFVKIEKDGLDPYEIIETSDTDGKVELTVSDKYVGGNILVRVRHQWYKGIEAHDIIPDYGYFYTAKIQHDFTFWNDSPSPDPEWKSEDEYLRASAEKNQKLRQHRYKNWGVKVIYYIVLVGAPCAGLILGGWQGVTFGLGISVFLEVLSPYSIGLKKFWGW